MILLLLSLATATAVSGKPGTTPVDRRRAEAPEMVLQLGQRYPSQVLFTPDPNTVIGTDGPRIHVWDVATASIRRTLKTSLGGVGAVAPDGRTLATAEGSRVLFWDLGTGKIRAELETGVSEITALTFSSDGRRLATGSGQGAVQLWATQSRKQVGVLLGVRGRTWALAYAPDGKRLAIGSLEGPSRASGIQMWDTTRGTLLWEALPDNSCMDLSFSPDGKQLAAATRSTVLFESETGKILARPGTGGYSATVAFDPTGRQLARSVDDRVEVLSTESWEVIVSVAEGSPYTVRWSPDGKRLATVGINRVIRLRSPDTGAVTTVLGENRIDRKLVASPDGRLLSFMAGTKLTVFDCLQGAPHLDLLNNPVAQPEGFLPGSHTLIGVVRHLTADPRSEHLRLWDLNSGDLKGELPPPGAPRGTYRSTRSFAVSPNGRLLITTTDSGPFFLWDVRTLQLLRTIEGPRDSVFSPVFAGNRHLAAVHPDGKGISLWDVETGDKLWSKTEDVPRSKTGFSTEAHRLAASPSGDLLAVCSTIYDPSVRRHSTTVQLYRLPQGTPAGVLSVPGSALTALEFSRDGSLLAAGASNGSIRWWDMSKLALVRETVGDGRPIHDLAFTPAGELVSTALDSTARLWNLDTGKWRLTWIFDLQSRVDFRLTGWLVTTPEGYYTTYGSADRLIRWRQGKNLFPASRFEKEYRKPERIRAIMAAAWR